MITEKEIKEILLKYSTEFLGYETIDESSYYDYADDINELLVKKLTIPVVSQRSELLPKRLSNQAYRKAKTMRYEDFVRWWDEQV